MKKYQFRSLAMLGEMYTEDGKEAGIKSETDFYLASDVDAEIERLRHTAEVEYLRAERLARPGDKITVRVAKDWLENLKR